MFLVINRLKVKAECVDDVVQRFSRSYGLEQSPGFVRFQLLEPQWSPGADDPSASGELLSMTEWESREAFEGWVKSDAFKAAHQNSNAQAFAGPPQVVGYVPRVVREADSSVPSTARMKQKLKMARMLSLVVVGLAALILTTLAGCDDAASGSSDLPVVQPSADAQPIRLTDDAGRTVQLAGPAQRIVAGSSSALELLLALGETPVLRPATTDGQVYPPEAKDIATVRVDHGAGPDLEALATAQPDLVVLHTHFAGFAPGIEQTLNVPVMLIEVNSLDDVSQTMQLLSQAAGGKPSHTEAIRAVQHRIDQARSQAGVQPIRVLALFGTPEAFFAYRETSYLGSMLDAMGAVNVAEGRPPMGRLRSVAPLDMEQVIAKSPQVILVVPHGDEQAVMGYLQSHPIWNELSAVKSGAVHMLDESLFSSNPGPRAPEAMAQLSRLLQEDPS